jgi:hypothetical protein
MKIEGGSTRSHSVGNLVWKKLRTTLNIDYGMMSDRVFTTDQTVSAAVTVKQ